MLAPLCTFGPVFSHVSAHKCCVALLWHSISSHLRAPAQVAALDEHKNSVDGQASRVRALVTAASAAQSDVDRAERDKRAERHKLEGLQAEKQVRRADVSLLRVEPLCRSEPLATACKEITLQQWLSPCSTTRVKLAGWPRLPALFTVEICPNLRFMAYRGPRGASGMSHVGNVMAD